MTAKLFEIRDRATCMPMVAIKLDPANDAEAFLLFRAGWTDYNPGIVLFGKIDGNGERLEYEPFAWGDNRSRSVAHAHIAKHFDTLEPGAVIDVEFILGETREPKTSERLEVL